MAPRWWNRRSAKHSIYPRVPSIFWSGLSCRGLSFQGKEELAKLGQNKMGCGVQPFLRK